MQTEYSAGALLFRKKEGLLQTLLVCAQRNEWGFPKGHLEEGESAKEAAKREILEETNLQADFSEDFSICVRYTMPSGKHKVVTYFICTDFTGSEKPQEGEILSLLWATQEEAQRLLPYAQLKTILRAAFAAQEV